MTRCQRFQKEMIEKLNEEKNHNMKRIREWMDRLVKSENNSLKSDEEKERFATKVQDMIMWYSDKINKIDKMIEEIDSLY